MLPCTTSADAHPSRCPELSGLLRLSEKLELARRVLEAEPTVVVNVLDLSRLASEYGRHIHPCKGCFSTAAALCHWPCSCYPNYSLGQTQDWMNESKDARTAKEIELAGWSYPGHLKGRLFACVVHGDAEGAAGARRCICAWLCSATGHAAVLERYIGYWQPYATNHQALQDEVANAARTLLEGVRDTRQGMRSSAGTGLPAPRRK